MLIVWLAVILCSACGSARPPEFKIELEAVFDINSLEPSFKFLLSKGNPLAIDSKNRFYFVDIDNHRILVFDEQGAFLRQVGSIGQGPADLYYPVGVQVWQDRLIVLNQSGKEIKLFTGNGDLLSSVLFPDTFFGASGVWVDTGGIYTDPPSYRIEPPLVRRLSLDGEEIGGFGEVIAAKGGHMGAQFNWVYLAPMKDRIFGVHKFFPLLFAYNDRGEKLLSIDLRTLDLPEFTEIEQRIKEGGFDTPEGFQVENRSYLHEWTSCFTVYNDKYLLNGLAGDKPFLLFFNLEGEFLARVLPVFQDQPIKPLNLIKSEKGTVYLVGGGKNRILFKLNLLKR